MASEQHWQSWYAPTHQPLCNSSSPRVPALNNMCFRYRGLSSKFLSFKVRNCTPSELHSPPPSPTPSQGARLLMLAGTDRLDKELMIGQMQGKFQMVVLPASGHCVQALAPNPSTAAGTHPRTGHGRSAGSDGQNAVRLCCAV